MGDLTPFAPWLDRWELAPDGEPFRTHYNGNWLIPVRRGGEAAILKVTTADHEMAGGALMAWLAGDGAARVLEREGGALLLERLPATRSLAEMARSGGDDEASRIICAVGDRLHAPRAQPPPETLIPLTRWFRALAPAAAALALRPGRLAHQIDVIADAARLDPRRLLQWTLAHAGISAAWCMKDGFDPAPALALAEIAKALVEAG